jgi:transcriptional regulator with XRE-family HTH domain
MPNENPVGNRIRERRRELSWTQEKLAKEAGISKGFLSDVENGNSEVSASKLMDVAKALSVTMDYLMKGEGEKSPELAQIQVPASLGELARTVGLSFSQTLLLLDMRSQILAHRSTSKSRNLDDFDWRKFYESVKEYLK